MSKRNTQRSGRASSAQAARERAKRARARKLTRGAAAAERASAGMGTEALEPTDWLFGGSIAESRP